MVQAATAAAEADRQPKFTKNARGSEEQGRDEGGNPPPAQAAYEAPSPWLHILREHSQSAEGGLRNNNNNTTDSHLLSREPLAF